MLIFDYFSLSYLLNSLVFSAFVLILYLVLTDDRFTFNRKIFFLILTFGLFCLSFYIEKAPYEIIKELFWYSLILNGSFIFHTLILDRAFHWCWKNHYEYLGFIISRVSFTFSLSGIFYGLKCLDWYIYYNFFVLYFKNDKSNKYIYHNLIEVIINLLKTIILYFIIVFKNYELILLGQYDIKKNWKNILNLLIWFIIYLIISILLGLPRLYIIWLCNSLKECYLIWIFTYFNKKEQTSFLNLSILEKLQFTYSNWNHKNYINNYLVYKLEQLNQEWYEKCYHTFFVFDLFKFLKNQSNYDNIYNNIEVYEPYPFKKIYKFYPWEEMIIAYSGINIEDTGLNPNYDDDLYGWGWNYAEHDESINLVKNSLLINKDYNFIKKVHPKFTLKQYNIILNELNK